MQERGFAISHQGVKKAFGCHGRQALEVTLCEPVFEY
jgi:hypothetical protein